MQQYVALYTKDPVSWVENTWGIKVDTWQKEVLNAYASGERRISIRSAHGVGKTAVAAWLSIHHLTFRFPQKTAATAPSRPQAFDAYFAEVKHWMKMMPEGLQALFDVKADRIELKVAPQSSFLSVRTSRQDQPEALQGIHAKYVLLIVDEASGVPEAVFESAAGSMSGENALTMLIGNPTKTSGLFFDTHHRLKDKWHTIHVSAFDSERVSFEFIQEMEDRYGCDSNAFRIRALGEFPTTDDDSVIPFHLIEAAKHREIQAHPESIRIWGVDIARFGSDRSTLAKRHGSVQDEPVKVWKGLDLMALTGQIKHELDMPPPSELPREIYIDAIGMGAGVADRLRELKLPGRAINVSETTALKTIYPNLRSELWFRVKEWLDTKVVSLHPDDHELHTELSMPWYYFASNGKTQVATKDEMKMGKKGRDGRMRGGKGSPDIADAWCLTFAGGGAILTYGSAASSSWDKPLKRGIKGV